MGLTSKARLRGIAATARRMRAAGWSVQSIARLYRVTRMDVLAILRAPPPRLPRPAKQPKPVDPWKGTWRYRGDDDLIEFPVAPAIDQVTDQGGAAAIPAAELEQPAPSTWSGPSSPYVSGPRKMTREALTRALELRSEGKSWPAIARELGCHRMAIYHALRRLPL